MTSRAAPWLAMCILGSSKSRLLQICLTDLHLKKRWPQSSSRRWHIGQRVSSSITLLLMFTLTGWLLCANLHINTLILLVTFRPHIFFPHGLIQFAHWGLRMMCLPYRNGRDAWLPMRMQTWQKISPLGSACQATVSSMPSGTKVSLISWTS